MNPKIKREKEKEKIAMENPTSSNKQSNSWTNTEIRNLIMMMAVFFSDLKDYGQEVDLDIILSKYRIYFEKEFSTDHIVYAIQKHCERSREIPRVCDIMDVLKPQPPQISVAEYQAAQDWQKRNNFPMYSDAKSTIEAFEKQQGEKREDHRITNERILEIAQSSIKMIGNS